MDKRTIVAGLLVIPYLVIRVKQKQEVLKKSSKNYFDRNEAFKQ